MTTIRLEERFWKAPEDLRRLHALRIALDSTWKLSGLWKADESAMVVRCGAFQIGLRDTPLAADVSSEGDFSYRIVDIIDTKRGVRVPLDTFRRLAHPGMDDQERDVYEQRIAELRASAARLVEAYTEERMEVQATIEGLKEKLRSARMQAAGREA